MTQDQASEDEKLRFIKSCLAKLNMDYDQIIRCKLLRGGISGSHTWRIALIPKGETISKHIEVVLKATTSDAESYVIQRAQRELAFYQTLAERIPLCVPQVLSSYTDDTSAIYLLLTAYQPTPPPAEWDEARYLEVAQQLARFHATFWDRADDLAVFPWLRRRCQKVDTEDVRNAYGYWQNLMNERRFGDVLTPQRHSWLREMLERIEEVDLAIKSLPITLCHGDCHIGNLLEDSGGNLIWADWQEVGLARGPEDLSFLFQRASFEGGTPPYRAVIHTYQENLEAVIGEKVSLTSIRRVIYGSELWTRLLHWPLYLTQATPESLADMLIRIEELVNRLGLC
jgi:hypothetical protein